MRGTLGILGVLLPSPPTPSPTAGRGGFSPPPVPHRSPLPLWERGGLAGPPGGVAWGEGVARTRPKG